ncbi:glycosyltransferase family 2 protein [Klebsiella variicola]|uniref:glycosyltransferase family 2 protein n=1 Tax=Klebsiella variicola TaxID=244366 RepID=UPI000668BF44|nr:glycosyltransferase family 2 protein [Klebsiella variicola]
MEKIQVLLATYNGSKYIREQINSILNNFQYLQDYDCGIIISDDNSTDNTVNIINECFHDNEKVRLLSASRKGGVKNNFTYLIEHADADFLFFCDQDDLWLPEKLRIFMDAFNKNTNEKNTPLLVHSDLCVTDSLLSPIHKSMFEYQKINKHPSFANLIVSNSITGCVLGINRALLNIIKEKNINESIMHDWYIGLVASCFGRLIFIPKSLILYRQHSNNQVGAKEFSFSEIFNFTKVTKIKQSIYLTKMQAELFLNDFNDTLESKEKQLLVSYIKSFDSNFFLRFNLFFNKGIRKYGFVRNSVFFIFYVVFAKLINAKNK